MAKRKQLTPEQLYAQCLQALAVAAYQLDIPPDQLVVEAANEYANICGYTLKEFSASYEAPVLH